MNPHRIMKQIFEKNNLLISLKIMMMMIIIEKQNFHNNAPKPCTSPKKNYYPLLPLSGGGLLTDDVLRMGSTRLCSLKPADGITTRLRARLRTNASSSDLPNHEKYKHASISKCRAYVRMIFCARLCLYIKLSASISLQSLVFLYM